MNEVPNSPNSLHRLAHGHHGVAASIFVGSLIIGAAMVMSAELTKPERYEFHPSGTGTSYIIYDKDTGRATTVDFDTKSPTDKLTK